jgi:hypothetical protein
MDKELGLNRIHQELKTTRIAWLLSYYVAHSLLVMDFLVLTLSLWLARIAKQNCEHEMGPLNWRE